MKKLSRSEMKNVKGGLTPCISACFSDCLDAGGSAQVISACKLGCRIQCAG